MPSCVTLEIYRAPREKLPFCRVWHADRRSHRRHRTGRFFIDWTKRSTRHVSQKCFCLPQGVDTATLTKRRIRHAHYFMQPTLQSSSPICACRRLHSLESRTICLSHTRYRGLLVVWRSTCAKIKCTLSWCQQISKTCQKFVESGCRAPASLVQTKCIRK